VPKDHPGNDKNKNFITPVHGSSQEKESFIRNNADANQRELEEEWGDDDNQKNKPDSPEREEPKKVNHLAINTASLDEVDERDSPKMSEMVRIERESEQSESVFDKNSKN
jgi:hypothetical protein